MSRLPVFAVEDYHNDRNNALLEQVFNKTLLLVYSQTLFSSLSRGQ